MNTISALYDEKGDCQLETAANIFPGFEGPEKRLEIDFRPSAVTPLEGLRSFSQERWQELLNYAKCTILHSTSNESFDSYVLSESSLFVYPSRIMIKTCGTTTLLHCVKEILQYAFDVDLSVELVRYSRKAFLFPEQQKFPHREWQDEVEYLNEIFQRGVSYILGPKSEHEQWNLYLADFSDRFGSPSSKQETKTIEIMMHNLHPEAAKEFFRKEGISDRDKHPAMRKVLNNCTETDEFHFSPCGYSMNGLEEEFYHTVHVTPEFHCSYASYETNSKMSSYQRLISQVFHVFRPGTAQLALFTERTGSTPEREISKKFFADFEVTGYKVSFKTVRAVDANCDVILLNYVSHEFKKSRKRSGILSS